MPQALLLYLPRVMFSSVMSMNLQPLPREVVPPTQNGDSAPSCTCRCIPVILHLCVQFSVWRFGTAPARTDTSPDPRGRCCTTRRAPGSTLTVPLLFCWQWSGRRAVWRARVCLAWPGPLSCPWDSTSGLTYCTCLGASHELN